MTSSLVRDCVPLLRMSGHLWSRTSHEDMQLLPPGTDKELEDPPMSPSTPSLPLQLAASKIQSSLILPGLNSFGDPKELLLKWKCLSKKKFCNICRSSLYWILLLEGQRALAFTDGEAETKRGKTSHTVNPSLNPDFQLGRGSDSRGQAASLGSHFENHHKVVLSHAEVDSNLDILKRNAYWESTVWQALRI